MTGSWRKSAFTASAPSNSSASVTRCKRNSIPVQSDDETPAPVELAPPRKRKLTPKLKIHLAAIAERKRFTDRPDFKALAARLDTTAGALRRLWYDFTKGKLDIGVPESPEEAKIDARVQHERTVDLLRRMKVLDLDMLESLIHKAEDERGKTKGAMPKESTRAALSSAKRELKYSMDLEHTAQKGYISVLEELAAAHQRAQRPLQNTREVETAVVNLSEEDRARRALGLTDEILPPEVTSGFPEQDGSGD